MGRYGFCKVPIFGNSTALLALERRVLDFLRPHCPRKKMCLLLHKYEESHAPKSIKGP